MKKQTKQFVIYAGGEAYRYRADSAREAEDMWVGDYIGEDCEYCRASIDVVAYRGRIRRGYSYTEPDGTIRVNG